MCARDRRVFADSNVPICAKDGSHREARCSGFAGGILPPIDMAAATLEPEIEAGPERRTARGARPWFRPAPLGAA
jgi:hypothetical protein